MHTNSASFSDLFGAGGNKGTTAKPVSSRMSRSHKEKQKRKHSHHSRYESSDDSDQSESSSDSSMSDSSSSDSESSVEVVKKRRLSSEDYGKSKKARSESARKHKKSSKKKSKHKKPKIVKISEDDYYLKSAEFRTWLSKEKDTFFSELKSDESRKLFRKFVAKWNKGLLSKKYYEGIQSTAVSHNAQSKYRWKFARGVDSDELKSIRESVSSWSSSQGSEFKNVDDSSQPGLSTRGMIGPSAGPSIGPARGPTTLESPYDREERRKQEQHRLKKERKTHKKQRELVLDELLPKATGREAKIEKRKAHAEQRRAREYSPEPVTEKFLMGQSDNIQARIRSIQEKRERKASGAAQKILDYRAKEKARMDALLEMAKATKKDGSLW